MRKKNLIKRKSYEFALEIIRIYKVLTEQRKEYVMSKQLLKCGTSIGANVEEAIGGQTIKDFITKIFIAYKEAREAKYWVSLLHDTKYIDYAKAKELQEKIEEICKILGKIISTTRQRY